MNAQLDLLADRPSQVTVSGEKFFGWCARAKAGEIHIYRAKVVRNGVYELSITWLDGRMMQDVRTKL